jgi:hypothetical protein
MPPFIMRSIMMPPKKRFSYAFSSISLIAYSWVYEKVKKKTSSIEALRRAKIGDYDGPWAISGECPEQSKDFFRLLRSEKTLSVARQKLSDKYKWDARADPDQSFIEFNSDGFVKSPPAARHAHGPEQSRRAIRHAHGPEQSRRAALRFIPALLNSRYARRRSRFNGVNHCGVL